MALKTSKPSSKADKPLTADDILRRKREANPGVFNDIPAVPESALVQLRRLCELNDAEPYPARRCGADFAIDMLKSYGVVVGKDTLNKICAKHLKRKSYAQA